MKTRWKSIGWDIYQCPECEYTEDFGGDIERKLNNYKYCPYCGEYLIHDAKKIRVGDKVRLPASNNRFLYSTYTDWVVKNIDNPYLATRYRYGTAPCDYDLDDCTVIKIARHGGNDEIFLDKMLAYLDTSFGCILVDVEALEHIVD